MPLGMSWLGSSQENPVRLLEDEGAYREVIGDFVDGQLSAERFLQRFRHLWQCDRTINAGQAAPPRGNAGLYGLLDSVNALCESYSHALMPGQGYRVSAEQLRKEIDCMTRDSALTTLPAVPTQGVRFDQRAPD
jgi:anti-sigma factor RsiW